MDGLGPLIVCVLIAAPVVLGIRIIEEGERGVLFRLGRFVRVVEPGLRWIIPSTDKLVRVRLLETVPDWEDLSSSQLNQRLEELARSGALARSAQL